MPIYDYIIVIVLAVALISYIVMFFVRDTKRKKQYEEEIKAVYSPEEAENRRLEKYKSNIAYWLNILEIHTSADSLTKSIKVKEALIDEYDELNIKFAEVNLIEKEQTSDQVFAYHPRYFGRTRIYFNGLTYRRVMPFIGEDGFYYAIVFKSTADALGYEFTKENLYHFLDDTFEVSLITYAEDNFINRKVKPVEYTPYYIPRMALNESYLIKPCYAEAEFYDT